MARGHRISQVNEIPLVVSNESVEGLQKTKKALAVLKAIKANEDSERVKNTLTNRAGKGKLRNRPYKERVGPLIVYGSNGESVARAFRAIPGVELVNVHNLSLLRLAPGGHLGRFVIWTRGAFEQLDSVFGTFSQTSKTKEGFRLPYSCLANPDIERTMRSDVIRSAFQDIKLPLVFKKHKNPYRNYDRMNKLNPYRAIFKKEQTAKQTAAIKAKEGKKKKVVKKFPNPKTEKQGRVQKLIRQA